jgi:hypothetical protein
MIVHQARTAVDALGFESCHPQSNIVSKIARRCTCSGSAAAIPL